MNTKRQLAREKLLFRYTTALERGDFATVEAILLEARRDTELERRIAEINVALQNELPPMPVSASRAQNNHRNNHLAKESSMIQPFPNTGILSNAPRQKQKRFPFALAAAVLAVILTSGLLLTAQFGFDHDTNMTSGASIQRESPTVPASATVTPSSTLPNSIYIYATVDQNNPEIDSTLFGTLIFHIPDSINREVLCSGVIRVDVFTDTGEVEPFVALTSRPGNTWLTLGLIGSGVNVEIFDQSYFPGGTGVWDQAPAMWYFISTTGNPSPLQGWIPESFIELTSECPPLPDYDAEYYMLGLLANVEGTRVFSGNLAVTVTPLPSPTLDIVSIINASASGTANAWTSTPLPTITLSVTPSPTYTPTPLICNPANPARLEIGDAGRVIGEGKTGVNLRQAAGFEQPLLELLERETEFEVVEGPVCVVDTHWYLIAIDGDEAGWIPETMWVLEDGAASSVYVIEAVE